MNIFSQTEYERNSGVPLGDVEVYGNQVCFQLSYNFFKKGKDSAEEWVQNPNNGREPFL